MVPEVELKIDKENVYGGEGAIMRAIKIDTEHQQIYEVDVTQLKNLKEIVGGNDIMLAFGFPDWSLCFVNDVSLFDPSFNFFSSKYGFGYQPFVGNAVIVGPAFMTGWPLELASCNLSLDDVSETTHFYSRDSEYVQMFMRNLNDIENCIKKSDEPSYL